MCRMQVEMTTMRTAVREIVTTLDEAATRNVAHPQEMERILRSLSDAARRAIEQAGARGAEEQDEEEPADD
jgi:hypothetical protein